MRVGSAGSAVVLLMQGPNKVTRLNDARKSRPPPGPDANGLYL